ncbi:L-tyrosine/L-tryptophan isonitrile synthase family protein [Psychrobacter sp. HII-4]|uniref:L-tyrosine/L-tryptophan isonitrile synthase family protein n=1 Tax=Psychrobacter sp. HII-4 TaxID=1569264 RepID=UPI0019188873|nr:L-tyrosine/L-tryptophan isonitrile synthase family protein [Psychrobacter sp. HII-4]
MSNNTLTVESLLADAMPPSNYEWPDSLPHLSQQLPKNKSEEDRKFLLKECSVYRDFDPTKFYNSYKNHSKEQFIIEFLNHHAFQFNSRRRFRESLKIQTTVKKVLKKSTPLDIVIPIFCVIGNLAKRIEPTTVTFAEACSLQSLQNISKLFLDMTSVELRFQIIADSNFYVRPLGSDPVISSKYLDDLKKYSKENELENLYIHDMCDMAKHDIKKFEDSYMRMYEKLSVDSSYGLDNSEHKAWISAMAGTITTRDIIAPYEVIVKTFRDSDFSSTFGREVLRRTEKAFIDYRALKYAMSQLAWEERYFPNSIRATIHQKKQDVLGLRIYPEYKKASKLLPYHGIAVLEKINDRYSMLIHPEINIASKNEVERYINNYNFSDFYIA